MNGIRPGGTYVITHDIGTAFRRGEQVVVEEISPDPQRPEYKYIVFSKTDAKRFRLSDADLTELPRTAPPEVAVTQTVAAPPTGGGSTGKTVGIVIAVLLVIGLIFGVLYLTLWRDSGTEQPTITQPTTPTTQPETQPKTEPTTPSSKYGTVKVSSAAYNEVRSGMSYSEVVEIFGGPGVKQSETGSPGTPGYKVKYAWDGERSGSAVFCTFEDDRMVEKSQEF